VQKLEDVAPYILNEISNFFQNYKVLQGIEVEVGEYYGLDEALKIIEECTRRYLFHGKE
jgi:inorganic pyrophosphatase